MNQSSFVFIESNTSGTGELFVKEIINRSLEPVFITKDPKKYSFLKNYLIHPVVLDTNDESAILEKVRSLASVVGVFSTSELYIETAANISKKIGLPCNNPTSIRKCRDKFLLSCELSQKDIKTPKTLKVSLDGPKCNDLMSDFTFPVIVKPSKLSGSVGVKLCQNNEDLLEFIEELTNKNKTAYFLEQDSDIIIQEYIDGEEYSVETITNGNKHTLVGITKKYLGKLPYFIEVGHDFPGLMPEDTDYCLIEETVTKALDAIGFRFGPAHTEIRISKNTPYVIEINPRLAGGMIPKLISISTGKNIISDVVDHHLGTDLSVEFKPQQFTSLRFILPPEETHVTGIDVSQVLDSGENFSEIVIQKDPSQIQERYNDFRDRIGYLLFAGNKRDDVLQSTEASLKAIKFLHDRKCNIHSISDTGLLKSTIHPTAYKILNRSSKSLEELRLSDYQMYAKINEAHILMLVEQGLFCLQNAKKIFTSMNDLKETEFSQLLDRKVERGTYIEFESYLLETHGDDIAGSIHLGRSRNDIIETIFRIQCRKRILTLFGNIWKLRSSLLVKARLSAKYPLPIYSQYQTAMPGNVCHYYLGMNEAFLRSQNELISTFSRINTSPLGNCAGGGTIFKINPSETASLLGFERVKENSMDGISNKDDALKVLSELAILSTTISRMASDLLLWSTQEFGFVRFPDDLVGCSSMLPQKRNPYLLEEIKTKTSMVTSNFSNFLSSVQGIPSGNSYEAKKLSNILVMQSFELIEDTVELINLHTINCIFNRNAMEQASNKSIAIAPIASELLSVHTGSTKAAHFEIGSIIHDSFERGEDPNRQISLKLSESLIKHPTQDENWGGLCEFGGGPGEKSTQHQLSRAEMELKKSSFWYVKKNKEITNADIQKEKRINQILNQ